MTAASRRFRRYALSIAFVAIGLAVGLGVEPRIGPNESLLVLVLAIAASARLLGVGPGLLATALSTAAALFFLVEPRYSFEIRDPKDAGGLLLLAIGGLGLSLWGDAWRRGGDASRPHDPSVPTHFLRRTALLGAAFLTFLVFIAFLSSDFQRQQDFEAWVTHSHQVLTEVQSMRSEFELAETAQRSYLLTGDNLYLKRYRDALRSEQSQRTALRRLIADNPAQRARMDSVERLVSARSALLQEMIALRTRGDAQGAVTLLRQDAGRSLVEWRATLREFEEEERRLLASRSVLAQSQTGRTDWLLGLGSGSILILLVVAGWVIERDIQQREEARHEARKREEHLRLALDAADAGTWEWDVRTNENVWSDQMWNLYGLAPHSMKPSFETWRQVMHPDDRARAERAVTDAARSGTDLSVEFRIPNEPHSPRWLLARAKPVRDPKGAVTRFIGIALDLTLRKQAEEALREREENLRRFADAAPVAIAMFDREMRYLAVSQRFRDDFALGNQPLLSRSHYEIFPEISEAWRQVHRRCLAGATERSMGDYFPRSNGSGQWIRWEIQPWRRPGGEIGGIVLFSEDISEQRRVQEAVREAAERLRVALEAAELGAWEYRFQSGEVFWDEQCRNTWGIREGQQIPYPDAVSRIHEEDRSRVDAAVQLALANFGDGAYHQEFRVVWPDRSVHWVASHGRVDFETADGATRPLHFIGVNMDITERKQAELNILELNSQLEKRVADRTAQLEAANRELEAFAYSVSHDLRAPLRGIDGWGLALLEDYGQQMEPPAQQYLHRVRSETQRMGVLIDDLLQLSQISRAEMFRSEVDLSELVQLVAGRLLPSCDGRNVKFQVEPGLKGEADLGLVEIALTNLLSNALKFTAPRAEARVEFGQTEAEGKRAFYVRDNGVGFDNSYSSKLFGAFQRLHKASEFPGTGIGLATVQRVIRRHGGEVWAESELGKGAVFYFTLGGT